MPRLIRTECSVYLGGDQSDPLARIDFTRSGDGTLVIQHTYVADSLKGQGVGSLLVYEVIAIARENHLKLLPLCPYARKVITRDTAAQDMLVEPPADN